MRRSYSLSKATQLVHCGRIQTQIFQIQKHRLCLFISAFILLRHTSFPPIARYIMKLRATSGIFLTVLCGVLCVCVVLEIKPKALLDKCCATEHRVSVSCPG